MVDSLGIGGVKPIGERPSGNNNRRRGGKGQKFSLDEPTDEQEQQPKKRQRPAQRKAQERLPDVKPDSGSIDILV